MAKEKFCVKCGSELVDGKCPNCKKEKSTARFSNNGYINRAALKEEARKKINGNLWNLWKPALILSLVGFISGFASGLFGEESLIASIISIILSLVSLPLTAGVILYNLNFVRGKKFEINDVFTFFDKRFLTLLLIDIVVALFTFLWSLLFIIPGIIASISYTMSVYVFVDGTKTDVMETIKESKRLMDGHKWEYFVFNLSFIGWVLLIVFTFGIAAIYVAPYMTVANTMYYDELKAIKEN